MTDILSVYSGSSSSEKFLMIDLRPTRPTRTSAETSYMSASVRATAKLYNQASSQTHSKCPSCTETRSTSIMATPLGAFASYKMREKLTSKNAANSAQEDNDKGHSSSGFFNVPKASLMNKETVDDNPTKYTSKAMMAIWGMYNRYSVHNFKSNMCSPVDKA